MSIHNREERMIKIEKEEAVKVIKALKDFSLALENFVKKLVEVIKPIFKKINELCQKLWDIAWSAYSEHGMPYGATDKGLLRWLNEMRLNVETNEALRRDLVWREFNTGG